MNDGVSLVCTSVARTMQCICHTVTSIACCGISPPNCSLQGQGIEAWAQFMLGRSCACIDTGSAGGGVRQDEGALPGPRCILCLLTLCDVKQEQSICPAAVSCCTAKLTVACCMLYLQGGPLRARPSSSTSGSLAPLTLRRCSCRACGVPPAPAHPASWTTSGFSCHNALRIEEKGSPEVPTVMQLRSWFVHVRRGKADSQFLKLPKTLMMATTERQCFEHEYYAKRNPVSLVPVPWVESNLRPSVLRFVSIERFLNCGRITA